MVTLVTHIHQIQLLPFLYCRRKRDVQMRELPYASMSGTMLTSMHLLARCMRCESSSARAHTTYEVLHIQKMEGGKGENGTPKGPHAAANVCMAAIDCSQTMQVLAFISQRIRNEQSPVVATVLQHVSAIPASRLQLAGPELAHTLSRLRDNALSAEDCTDSTESYLEDFASKIFSYCLQTRDDLREHHLLQFALHTMYRWACKQ